VSAAIRGGRHTADRNVRAPFKPRIRRALDLFLPDLPPPGKLNHNSDCHARRIQVSSRVLQLRALCKYWLPVLIWMALIFTASGDLRSYEHSSRILAPVLRWLFPHLSEDTINLLVFIARKCAHAVEYCVFALLLWRALRKPVKNDARPWNWRVAGIALLLAALYAASDELHQVFVATRTPRVHDVALDTLGGAAGLFVLWLIGRWRKRW
jgi:VanZ family protein